MPIGPSIPRRDQKEVYNRYCRLMLIFFKPWRHASDLRDPGQKWEQAFELFMQNCPHSIKEKMDNMQILHECRDSGLDHLTERCNKHRHSYLPSTLRGSDNNKTTDDFGSVDPAEILEHLESISSCTSERTARKEQNVNDCIIHAVNSGMYDTPMEIEVTDHIDRENHCQESSETQEVDDSNFSLEDQWKKEYELRRDFWKKKIAMTPSTNTNDLRHQAPQNEINYLNDGSQFRHALMDKSITATITQNIPPMTTETEVSIADMISELSLNTEQARAFQIICEHSLKKNNSPLKMYIGGAGGTGKSHVINSLKEFFVRRGQARRFRLASYTGVAAKNIAGMTVHAALGLNQKNSKGGTRNKTRRDLMAMWEGVDYLFIDEISMIGCKMLYKISEALIEAKGNTAPFGGINIIVAGDFAQLPPVGETRLSASINTLQTQRATNKGQENVNGKLLWLSFQTVVILKECMRQTGPENAALVKLLDHLREGKCTDNNYDMLSSRVLENVDIDWSQWRDTPIIVTENAQKDALNIRGAYAFAERSKRPLHWYYAIDTHQHNTVTDAALKLHLENLDSGQTNQRLGKIPLVIGMPVMITQNYDVEGGIVNGYKGILKRIRYQIDQSGNRYAISCVVESDTISSEPLAGLAPKQAVVMQETTHMTFRHPHSGKKCTIQRTQLPIVPAFAMTAHKAQGQTMDKALMDLESCKGTESPYVMVSRITSLDGLLILRPFRPAKIKCRQSEDTRQELKRLEHLRLQTIINFGTAKERSAALAMTNVNEIPTNRNRKCSLVPQVTHSLNNFSDSSVPVIETNKVSSRNESMMDIEIDSNSSSTPKPQHVRTTLASHRKRKLSTMDDKTTLRKRQKKTSD